MIIYELVGTENNETYRLVEHENSVRQLDFLNTMILSSLDLDQRFLSQTIIKALNYHAIAGLHFYAGVYRPCQVKVGEFIPPQHFRLPTLMDQFVNEVNRMWKQLIYSHYLHMFYGD